ncbi:dihydropteroate synthase [Pararhodobacter sp. SW119]|uniref:dihydropteroate synthase n=1 Tax=Pararhodobacter sp. SW119 TaxID=2780075 RepID=UPI001AE07889|nr:dihydropteroate synthase [Pararhodobacter sp. SW119]
MSRRILHWPEPRSDLPRPAGSRPLAGSAHVWFARVRAMDAARGPAEADPTAADRLAAPRPVLPGLPAERPLVMGIVNVTPDSFSDGGETPDRASAVERARAMVAAGADMLDIGGESTRPGAADVSVPEEIARTVPVIAELRAAGITAPISIDTRKAAVAEAALHAGANMVNDVAALTHDPELGPLVAEAGVPLCLMHAQGTPQTMQVDPRYDDALVEVFDWLAGRMDAANAHGIDRARLIVDPGIGFGKTVEHNITLLKGLALMHDLGAPILLGASRKRFIGTISGVEVAGQRQAGSLAVALHAAGQGAQIVRVHDVAETVQALALWRALTTEDA